MSHDKLDGIDFKRLFSSLASTEWKTWDRERVVVWLCDIFNARDERDRSFPSPATAIASATLPLTTQLLHMN
jgi:hypothetical protein